MSGTSARRICFDVLLRLKAVGFWDQQRMLASQSYFASAKSGRPHSLNILGRVQIAVVDNTTPLTSPLPFFQTEFLVDMTTLKASLRRRIETIKEMNHNTFGAGDILKHVQKCA